MRREYWNERGSESRRSEEITTVEKRSATNKEQEADRVAGKESIATPDKVVILIASTQLRQAQAQAEEVDLSKPKTRGTEQKRG
jgi:hypothetical protein